LQLLNNPGPFYGPQQFGICENPNSNIDQDVQRSLAIMERNKPNGMTPLTTHIIEICREVEIMKPVLQARGQRVALIICTDGLPTDASQDEFVEQLRRLEGLPIWLVIRLCTNEREVVDYYNALDAELELSIEVIDDFQGEAREIHKQNPWLTYAQPLHRMRELGYHDRLFDLLDERPLTPTEQKEICSIIFGEEKMTFSPDPGADWKGFVRHVHDLLDEEELQWVSFWGCGFRVFFLMSLCFSFLAQGNQTLSQCHLHLF
jgi:hypothetical protein